MSDSWLQQFIARWPELDISEKDSITKESIDNYYRELMRLMQKHDLLNKPDHIFCVYDTVLDTNHRVGVVNNYRVMPSQYTELTVMNCMNAAGHVLPPYIVFSGKRMTRDLVADGLPGTGGTTAPNGKMNSRSFLKFLKDHFLPIVPCSRDHPVLLLYDGYRPYVNMPLINWAKRQFIVPYLLPPHVCHSQQPKQDSAVFPLKAAYQHQCRQFLLDNIGRIVTRYDVCNIIGRAYQQVMTQEVIIPSFRDMGIVPYNPVAKPMGDIDDMKNTKIGDTRVKTEHVLVEVKTEQLEEVSVKTETF